jgi:hypothetical protein
MAANILGSRSGGDSGKAIVTSPMVTVVIGILTPCGFGPNQPNIMQALCTAVVAHTQTCSLCQRKQKPCLGKQE